MTAKIVLTLAIGIGGCAVERGDDTEPGDGISPRSWECAGQDTQVRCELASSGETDDPAAYACDAGDEGALCPPGTMTAEIAEFVEDLDAVDDFADLPWACLRTGANQRHCVKELALTTPTPGPRPGDEPGPADEPGPSAPESVPEPEVPGDCNPLSWEPYFCQLATARYREHGVNITFPCGIFDALATFESTLPGVPTVVNGDETLPSCHDGEWGMRDQAWLDAVGHGCLTLRDPILAMCQQAANYAPESGACRATGAW